MRHTFTLNAAVALVGLVVSTPTEASPGRARGIVASIDKPPITALGTVAGERTDIVITLDTSLDPDVPGRSLQAGRAIRVHFPAAFDLQAVDPGFPLANLGSNALCVPGNLQCSTAVLLQGWPQRPIAPPLYNVSIQGNSFVYTATGDIAPGATPGIKQMHLLLFGVVNPGPGHYTIEVEAETGPGGTVERGSALLQILPKPRPSIDVTSVFTGVSPNPNTIFQTTVVNAATPHPWSFLLWGRNGAPLNDVAVGESRNGHHLLRQGRTTVGHVDVAAPQGGEDYQILPGPVSTELPASPVLGLTPVVGGQAVARMDLWFVTGSASGLYVVTLSLNNGNTIEMYVTAE